MTAQRSDGFTLVEVLVTIFILGMMMVFIVSVASLVGLNRETRQKDIALRVVQQKMESLRASGYDNVGVSGTFADPLLADLPNSSASTTISDFNADIKKVVVGVAWQETGNPLRYISATTLIVNNGGL